MKHIIKKQVFNLLFETEQDAFYLQHRVSNYNQREIILVLQKVFDEICAEGQVVYIDKLEIDLGNILIKEIQNDRWSDLLEAKLREQLKKMPGTENVANPILREPEIFSVFRQWLFSMQNGYLPWNAGQVDETWYVKVLEAIASDYKIADELRLLLKTNTTIIDRIVLQHPVSFLVSLTESLTAEKQDRLFNVADEFVIAIQYLQRKEKNIPGKRNIEIIIWKKILGEVVSISTLTVTIKFTSGVILERLIKAFFNKIQITQLLKLKGIVSKLSTTLNAFKKIVEETNLEENNVHQIIKSNLSKKTNEVNKEKTEEIFPIIQENYFIQTILETDKQEVLSPAINEVSKNPVNTIGENEIFIQNAGVVLLHPFLNSFFKLLGYVEGNNFITAAIHRKAVYLIHFLATGTVEVHEHDMVIAKIMCAYPLDATIDSVIELTENELAEAENLLVAAISNWGILKSTSVTGLREGFLQRPAKLQVKNNELYLQVETNSIDVLLDHLPWNLSMIKLPWMEKILRVEWR